LEKNRLDVPENAAHFDHGKRLNMATRNRTLPTIKPRTRLVYFRISEDEFDEFCGLCEAQGVRSLSELARLAVRSLLHSDKKADISERLSELERCILELNHHLRALPQAQENKTNGIYRGDL
jgi:hypothetical protein